MVELRGDALSPQIFIIEYFAYANYQRQLIGAFP